MVFFFLVPSVPATIGNFVIPIMVGAKDLAFPKINLLSWYLYVVAGIMMICVLVLRRRGHRLDLHDAAEHALPEHATWCRRGWRSLWPGSARSLRG